MGVDECSHGARRDALDKIRDGRFDEFAVSNRALSDLGESPAKKSKLLEVNLDVEVQSQKVEEGVGNLVSEAEKPSDENKCSAKTLKPWLGTLVRVNPRKWHAPSRGASQVMVLWKVLEWGRKNRDEERVVRVLGQSLCGPLKIAARESKCLKNAASGVERKILMILVCWKLPCGMTFPRPRWCRKTLTHENSIRKTVKLFSLC